LLNKDELLEQMKKKFDDLNYRWNIERNKLEAKAQHESADVLKKFEEKRGALRQYQQQMADKLKELDNAGENALDDLKGGIEDAWKSLSTAFDKATSHFKKK
jgi:ribosome recycling factor